MNLFHLQQITVMVRLRLRIDLSIALVTIAMLRLGMILRRLVISIRLDFF